MMEIIYCSLKKRNRLQFCLNETKMVLKRQNLLFFGTCGLPQFVHSIVSFAITKGIEIYNV